MQLVSTCSLSLSSDVLLLFFLQKILPFYFTSLLSFKCNVLIDDNKFSFEKILRIIQSSGLQYLKSISNQIRAHHWVWDIKKRAKLKLTCLKFEPNLNHDFPAHVRLIYTPNYLLIVKSPFYLWFYNGDILHSFNSLHYAWSFLHRVVRIDR